MVEHICLGLCAEVTVRANDSAVEPLVQVLCFPSPCVIDKVPRVIIHQNKSSVESLFGQDCWELIVTVTVTLVRMAHLLQLVNNEPQWGWRAAWQSFLTAVS